MRERDSSPTYTQEGKSERKMERKGKRARELIHVHSEGKTERERDTDKKRMRERDTHTSPIHTQS